MTKIEQVKKFCKDESDIRSGKPGMLAGSEKITYEKVIEFIDLLPDNTSIQPAQEDCPHCNSYRVCGNNYCGICEKSLAADD